MVFPYLSVLIDDLISLYSDEILVFFDIMNGDLLFYDGIYMDYLLFCL
jgi:hypothetical protein